ncbi:glycoside hydrolase family 2 protein [Paenibacillus hodogayensis]|uniref:beta-mannosidase n=1 Tax=Paenibacillus hodogayensis TaxID=279208 RepID=A0ABV5W8L3_9BACL
MNSRFSLNGSWNLYYGPEQGQMPISIEAVKTSGWPVIEASVPGNVEIDLSRAGIEQDPFLAEHVYDYRKYEFYQWWYERSFDVPADFIGQDVILRLHGIDTFGTIWINGELAGTTDNMMIEHDVNITDYVNIGQTNHIAIRIESSINQARKQNYPVALAGLEHHDEMVWLRKPPHAFGWDIAPRLVSAGIWRDIEILGRERTYLKEVYYSTQSIINGAVQLKVNYRYETDQPFLDAFSVRLKGVCGDHTFEFEGKTNFCSDNIQLTIPQAKLWWPRGYGAAHLYEVTLDLLYAGEIVATRTEKIGFRIFKLETNFVPGDAGEFKVIVNDVPILVKGTNWVPLDALHSRDKGRLQEAFDLMVDIGCNTVRCWGGNVYEDHDFFDLCDLHGILVWQDFAMACAIYPQTDDFADMLQKEAVSIIKKLRNHASLLLWAGDNEIDQVYYRWGHRLPHARFNRISREILPRIVGSHDPYRAFVPSSPYMPEHIEGGDLMVPEQHNWGPRDYFKSDFYKHSTAHFISEIGYHGCPAIASLKKFLSPDKLWPYQNSEWDTHNTEYLPLERRRYDRNELMVNQVNTLFGFIPDTLEDLALASQISQAEAKKFFIEMVRLKKWRRTGVIWWNLLDCWPQISDAVVDYYFSKKIAYYYIKRVQQPICLMMTEMENWRHRIVLGNDSNESVWVDFQVEDGDTGDILLAGQVYSPANENVEIDQIKLNSASLQKFFVMKWTVGGVTQANHYISGYPPYSFEQYKIWLSKIESLQHRFSSADCYN